MNLFIVTVQILHIRFIKSISSTQKKVSYIQIIVKFNFLLFACWYLLVDNIIYRTKKLFFIGVGY